MNYDILLELVTELGYRLAMSGAETFRVEESINRILGVYGVESESFSIPNCLIVSIESPNGEPLTRMRRLEHHGNDLDSVERYSNLSRRICAEKPEPEVAMQWLRQTDESKVSYNHPIKMLGSFLGAFGFCFLFGGTLVDSLCAGICGFLIGVIDRLLNNFKVNQFFITISSAFIMAFAAYAMGAAGIADNTDSVVIGALMLLVPGLLFTNAMRDIIFGDTNSGTNRIVQVLLVAAAIALGTGVAWNVAKLFWGVPVNPEPVEYNLLIQSLACAIGCLGFAIQFNIHGPGGLLCILGGVFSWAAYCMVTYLSGNDILGYFVAGVVSAVYSEAMARVRKYPAISYLVVSIFPLIPGASIYYTTNYIVRGDMSNFASQGTKTIAIAGIIAVAILLVSTIVRFWGVWRLRKKAKSKQH